LDQYLVLGLAGAVALVAGRWLHSRPRWMAALWLVTVCFVPFWLGVNIKIYFMPTSLVGIYLLVVLMPVVVRRWSAGDLLMMFLIVTALAPIAAGSENYGYVFTLLFQWLVAYALGRFLPTKLDLRWICGATGIAFAGVALCAIAEYVTRFNFFSTLSSANPLYFTWSKELLRGGLPRAEAAFGHPIALGVCLALAVPLALAARFPLWFRLVLVALMAGGIVVTFSRTAMLCGAVGVALTFLFTRAGLSVQARAFGSVVIGVVAVVLAPVVSETFTAAGSEATNSATYREDLLALVPRIAVLGFSPSATRDSSGVLRFEGFKSIDSALILLGLMFGMVTLVVAIIMLALAVVVVLRGRASAPMVAIVAAIPAIVTVAFITQYGMWFWFVAGLAVYSTSAPNEADQEEAVAPVAPVADGHAGSMRVGAMRSLGAHGWMERSTKV
jgi:hypothetical protein